MKQQVQLDQWLKNETSELDGAAKSSPDTNAMNQLTQAAAHMGIAGAGAQSVLDVSWFSKIRHFVQNLTFNIYG